MSSPKRTARHAVKRAANSVSRLRTAPQPVKREAEAADGVSADAKHLAVALESGLADGRLDVLSTDALQGLIAAACCIYAARRAAGEKFTPVARNSLSATNVMLTASGLLRAADLAAFELGVWQGFTGR